jgi:hypothetical protein
VSPIHQVPHGPLRFALARNGAPHLDFSYSLQARTGFISSQNSSGGSFPRRTATPSFHGRRRLLSCPSGWSQYGSSCFKFFDEDLGWDDAYSECLVCVRLCSSLLIASLLCSSLIHWHIRRRCCPSTAPLPLLLLAGTWCEFCEHTLCRRECFRGKPRSKRQ